MIGCGYERHFAYADLLRGHEYLTHELVPNVCIAANMHFRLRLLARNSSQLILQLVLARQLLGVPINAPLLVDGNQRVVNADDRAEQSDEGCRGTDGCEYRQARACGRSLRSDVHGDNYQW